MILVVNKQDEKEKLIEMLEVLLENVNHASALGQPATLIENCCVSSFDFVINKAIDYIKEN